MAAWRRVFTTLAPRLGAVGGPGLRSGRSAARLAGVAVAGAVCGGLWLVKGRREAAAGLMTVCAQKEEIADEAQEKQSLRKLRFLQFASLECDGEYYMTPRDFLFSVMFENVQRKTKSRVLTKKEFDAMLTQAAKAKPGPRLFRDLGDKEN